MRFGIRHPDDFEEFLTLIRRLDAEYLQLEAEVRETDPKRKGKGKGKKKGKGK